MLIDIGNSGLITYSIKNNLCYLDSNGYINLEAINFGTDFLDYNTYIIDWSENNLQPFQISADNKIVQFLGNGTYNFYIRSTSSVADKGPFYLTVTSPDQLIIYDVKESTHSCIDTGSIGVYVSGGTPPYTYNIGSVSSTTNNAYYIASDLEAGTYSITVTDTNGCSSSTTALIRDGFFTTNFDEFLPPQKQGGTVDIRCTIVGNGPFSFMFLNTESNTLQAIDSLETKYLESYDYLTNTYIYNITNLITPGSYEITVYNRFNCLTKYYKDIADLGSISVKIDVTLNNKSIGYSPVLTIPIYDTILIPYHHIQSNSDLWQLVKRLSAKNRIDIKINDVNNEFIVVRSSLDKYCLDNNKIQILRLGNESKDWYYYFNIAPSVNLNQSMTYASASYKIFEPKTNKEFDLTFGLNYDGNLDFTNASLIRGNFILNSISSNQFFNNCNINIALSDANDFDTEIYDFYTVENKKYIYKNIYNVGFVTVLNFLENFTVLNEYVDIDQTACSISAEQKLYIDNIKDLLKSFNNLNNYNSIYIYNLDNIENFGSIDLQIVGPTEIPFNNELINNVYAIDYFTFDENSTEPSQFIRNNQIVKNILNLNGIDYGYVIIRIKDYYNNIPSFINYGIYTLDYENHFIESRNVLLQYNSQIVPYFEYGDILVYVPSRQKPSPPIESSFVITTLPSIPPPIVSPSIPTVEQTKDSTNTSSLSIISSPKNIRLILEGPKNYTYSFIGDINFTNLIPGVYIIKGDKESLDSKYYYQNETRVIVDKNTAQSVFMQFISYNDKLFIKER